MMRREAWCRMRFAKGCGFQGQVFQRANMRVIQNDIL